MLPVDLSVLGTGFPSVRDIAKISLPWVYHMQWYLSGFIELFDSDMVALQTCTPICCFNTRFTILIEKIAKTQLSVAPTWIAILYTIQQIPIYCMRKYFFFLMKHKLQTKTMKHKLQREAHPIISVTVYTSNFASQLHVLLLLARTALDYGY